MGKTIKNKDHHVLQSVKFKKKTVGKKKCRLPFSFETKAQRYIFFCPCERLDQLEDRNEPQAAAKGYHVLQSMKGQNVLERLEKDSKGIDYCEEAQRPDYKLRIQKNQPQSLKGQRQLEPITVSNHTRTGSENPHKNSNIAHKKNCGKP